MTWNVPMIPSHLGQRVVGVIFLLVGAGLTGWTWFTALNEGYFYGKIAVISPAFAVLGAAALFFPLDVERQRGEFSLSHPERFAHYPTSWKILTVVAILAGLGNGLVLEQV